MNGKAQSRAAAPPPRDRRFMIAMLVTVGLAVAWLFWPSRYSGVENLDSNGTAIIALGDSITAGYGAGNGEDYPARVASTTGLTIRNAGVSGDTTGAALARLERDVLAHDPRIVIVGLGGNDFLRSVPIADTERNLRSIIDAIQADGAMVVLLGFRFPSLQVSYESMYERLAEEKDCLLIPDVMDGILSKPELRSDAIHPNAAGYELLAERVAPQLQRLVEAAD